MLESFRWEHPATRATFGTSAEEALATREMAYNQGFYNLFLAVVTAVGVVVFASSHPVGSTLIVTGCGSMLAAALVLAARDRSLARAAAIQGTPAALALLLLAFWALA